MSSSKIWFYQNGGGSGSNDVYYPFSQSIVTTSTTESNQSFTMRASGTISNLRAHVTANTTAVSTSCTLRINASNGNMTFTVSAGTTGIFQDTTNTDTISSGDAVTIFFDRASSISIQSIGALFTPDGSNIVRVSSNGYSSFGTNGATRYLGFCGDSTLSATENEDRQMPIRTDATIKNFFARISANTRSNATTLRVRNNASNGNSTISVGSSSTGYFEDTSNTDSVVQGDYVCYSLEIAGSGSGSLTVSHIGCDLEFPSSTVQYFSATLSGSANSATTSRWVCPVGSIIMNGSRTYANMPFQGSGKIKQFFGRVSSNASTATLNAYVEVATVDSSVTFSVPATTTGSFSDTTNEATFTDGQNVNIRTIKSNSGATTFIWFTYLVQFDSTFTPKVLYY